MFTFMPNIFLKTRKHWLSMYRGSLINYKPSPEYPSAIIDLCGNLSLILESLVHKILCTKQFPFNYNRLLNGVRKILIYLIKYANLPVLADNAWQRRSMPTGHKGNSGLKMKMKNISCILKWVWNYKCMSKDWCFMSVF